jgi:hypothetical protein
MLTHFLLEPQRTVETGMKTLRNNHLYKGIQDEFTAFQQARRMCKSRNSTLRKHDNGVG